MLDINAKPDKPLVAASILSADFGCMADDARDVLDQGADLLHVDVMDGHFVPNLTMGQDMIRGLRKHFPDTFLDVHLMVERPEDYIDPFAQAGANMFTFHLEVCGKDRDAFALIKRVREAGMKVGMAVNPPTNVTPLEPYLSQLDLALVMSVNPGRSGQAFIPDVVSKAQWLDACRGKRQSMRIEMDGGLSPDTAPQAVAAGVDMIVTASALFGADDRAEVIDALHRA